MGSTNSRVNHPPRIDRSYPKFEHFIEVAPGFWNCRVDFIVFKVNIKSHMSVARLSNGDFVSIDAVTLSSKAKSELDQLTQNGEKLVGCLHTHPFHTMAIPAFHAAYPGTDHRKYYGCPRHLKKIREDSSGAPITWAGDLNTCAARDRFLPDLEMRIPAGSEFVNPKPPNANHFSNVFVFHPASKVVVQDDTVTYIRKPLIVMRVLGLGPYSMHFHSSIKGPGLKPTPEAPLEFIAWFQKMLDDWDFDTLISAHNGGCYGIGKITAQKLLTASEPQLRQLSKKNLKNASEAGGPAVSTGGETQPVDCGWSSDPNECECG
mmetsp:Transcript_1561/g.2793  ORF Transcript_1561/g.2793 Transcript_1561/m.2793 type:complete len:319 (-) Transcript_1561:317-1273(-)|eukprot:CAMPEP_0198287238 /NCGR_PEP_ID=MMETSP1449-20131203/6130_1 /TAXON_ID=420275 /ORGANISM="Attheya septentrionalis, Strain CCMP2084" /LENGTH=318 /DNA_ID=CAMNT_0043985171 /DNA_START=75 /DNA_END=1031 /DNA_ORIENTATION=-